MKYSAIAVIFGGIATACFALFMATSAGPTVQAKAEPTRYLPLILLLGFAVALVVAGVVMLRFGGKGYTVTERPNASSANPANNTGQPLQPADGTN